MKYYRLYNVNNSQKSAVRGYWTDKDKLYVDNIHIRRYTRKDLLYKDVSLLFKKGEKAVFYTLGDIAIIQDNNNNKTKLRHRQLLKRDKISKTEVKALLKRYGGLTIYNNKKSRGIYHIEIWQK